MGMVGKMIETKFIELVDRFLPCFSEYLDGLDSLEVVTPDDPADPAKKSRSDEDPDYQPQAPVVQFR
jgi:hypothetical protein